VYEFDRPQTSEYKQGRVQAVLGGPPANLTYVAADLEREALPDALARHGYDVSRKTFIIMEGVSMYVQEQPLRDTLRFFATHAPGSSVVFDFATTAMITGMKVLDLEKIPLAARAPFERIRKLIEHEPWVFGVPLDGERAFLSEVGLRLGEMITIGSEQSARRYLARADGTTMGAEAHARAEAFRETVQQQMLDKLDPALREHAAKAMREQMRQNAYRIAEAFA
jgi:methyltransferase (TIGR00027 family)